jgi:hypothetical protein
VAPGGACASRPIDSHRSQLAAIISRTRAAAGPSQQRRPQASGHEQVPLTKVSLVGGTKVTVPPGIRVEASGFSLIGGTMIVAGPEPGPGAPTVRVRAFALVGGVRIRRSGTSER